MQAWTAIIFGILLCVCVSFAPAAIYRTSDAFQCLIIFSPCMRFGSIPPSQDPPGTWSPYLNPTMAHILGRRNREREFTFPICSAQNVRHFWVHVWGAQNGFASGSRTCSVDDPLSAKYSPCGWTLSKTALSHPLQLSGCNQLHRNCVLRPTSAKVSALLACRDVGCTGS